MRVRLGSEALGASERSSQRSRRDFEERDGNAIDLRDAAVSPERLAEAVRDEDDALVACPEAGLAHERIGLVPPDRAVSVRAVVAAAARSRGATAPQADELAAVRADLADLAVPDVDLADARRRVAEAGDDEAGLRERVARLRGEVQARRETGADAESAEAELREAVRDLSEAETERVAAEQALARARERAREARDARERRLRLRDRERNLARAARDHLAERHYDAFADAVEAVPGDADPGDHPAECQGDDATVVLAGARMADLRAPVVVACGRFASAAAARRTLDTPVLLA
jgi:hypothetical protein